MQWATEAQETPSTDGAAGSSTGHNGHRPTILLILTKTRSRTEADESAEMLCKLHNPAICDFLWHSETNSCIYSAKAAR